MLRIIITLALFLISQIGFSQNTIMWKVTDTINNKTSTIVGTIHQFGNSFVDSIPKLKEHLYKADLAIFEAIDDRKALRKLINSREDTNIKKGLKKKTYNKLLILSKNWKSKLHKLKPIEVRFALQQEYVKTKCKTTHQNDTWDHFDFYLQHLAKEKGIKLFGFETSKQQLKFISRQHNYPDWKKQRKIINAWIKLYNKPEYDSKVCALSSKYRNFDFDYKLDVENEKHTVLINERNENWMKILPDLLSKNNCFVAVGLYHLYFKSGLLNKLKQEGFVVEAINIK